MHFQSPVDIRQSIQKLNTIAQNHRKNKHHLLLHHSLDYCFSKNKQRNNVLNFQKTSSPDKTAKSAELGHDAVH